MKKAIITGTFDPVTVGHLHIVERAAEIFDAVYVCVLNNSEKRTMFTGEERLWLVCAATEGLAASDRITCECYEGLTSDYMRERGITHIVKGVRNAADFDYEYGIAQIMKKFLPGCETVLLPSAPEYIHVSSTFVRELIKYGGPLEEAVPAGTAELILRLYGNKK